MVIRAHTVTRNSGLLFAELLDFTSDFPVKDDLLLFDFIESHLTRPRINSVGI
jgi:hypothetical protein